MQIAIAKRGLEEEHCGDQAGCWARVGRTTLCVIDGLGHGQAAERAAKTALDLVARHHYEALPDIFSRCDEALRHTRGVAMGIAVVHLEAGTLTYAAVGNTRALVAGREVVRLSSHPGIVGAGYRMLTLETVPLLPGDLVILSTDGIEEFTDMSSYDDLLRADVRRLAERILQDWGCETDDAGVLVFRSDRDGA